MFLLKVENAFKAKSNHIKLFKSINNTGGLEKVYHVVYRNKSYTNRRDKALYYLFSTSLQKNLIIQIIFLS